MWDTIKCTNICEMRMPKKFGDSESRKNIWRINGWNHPIWRKILIYTFEKLNEIQVRETGKTQRSTNRNILVKILKDKEKIFKAARAKWIITYEVTSVKLKADFLADTMDDIKYLDDIFEMFKEKNFQPRILCPIKLSKMKA